MAWGIVMAALSLFGMLILVVASVSEPDTANQTQESATTSETSKAA